MKLRLILGASVVAFYLFGLTAERESAWGADLTAINDFVLKPGDQNAPKQCTNTGGTLYRDGQGRECCHPQPPPPPPCVSQNKPGEHCNW